MGLSQVSWVIGRRMPGLTGAVGDSGFEGRNLPGIRSYSFG